MKTALTADQYRDLHTWLGKPMLRDVAIFIAEESRYLTVEESEMDEMVSVMLARPSGVPTTDDVLGTDFYAMPSINTTPINRLRVLADEIQKVASELYVNSLPRSQDVFDDAKDIRESIGKMIAFAALNTPIRSKP